MRSDTFCRLHDWFWRIWDWIERLGKIGTAAATGSGIVIGGISYILGWSTPLQALMVMLVAIAAAAMVYLTFCAHFDRHKGVTGQPTKELHPVSEQWSLRDLFAHLAPHLPLRATKKTATGAFVDGVDPRWYPIGDIVLKPLSLGTLHAIGRQRIRQTKRLQAAPIPAIFWREAKFTYWFLDAGPSNISDASDAHDSYSEIEVNGAEAIAIWPRGAEFSLLDAAREIYENVKDEEIGVIIAGLTEGADDILTWICNAIAMYQNGKEPLVKLRGNEPPSRKIEEIYTAPLNNYDFIVEGQAVILQARYGKSRYENLTVTATDVDHAIQDLRKRQV